MVTTTSVLFVNKRQGSGMWVRASAHANQKSRVYLDFRNEVDEGPAVVILSSAGASRDA